MNGRSELLVGCGASRQKRLYLPDHPEWSGLETLDINPAHDPTYVWDLNKRPLPFGDHSLDEVHAYEVLEHLGRQGDYEEFFAEWMEWYRILKGGGILFGTSPASDSPWLWGDPGHTRAIVPGLFVFLDQTKYANVGSSPMSDYRFCYSADFELVFCEVLPNTKTLAYALRAVKPPRSQK